MKVLSPREPVLGIVSLLKHSTRKLTVPFPSRLDTRSLPTGYSCYSIPLYHPVRTSFDPSAIYCRSLEIVTGRATRAGKAWGTIRVRVRVVHLGPQGIPVPQPRCGGSDGGYSHFWKAEAFKAAAKQVSLTKTYKNCTVPMILKKGAHHQKI